MKTIGLTSVCGGCGGWMEMPQGGTCLFCREAFDYNAYAVTEGTIRREELHAFWLAVTVSLGICVGFILAARWVAR